MLPLKDDIPTLRPPIVTVGIIALNILVFLYQLSLGQHQRLFIYALGVVPYEITNNIDLYPQTVLPLKATLITSMFIHGGLFHIFSNMLYLWIFGNNVEDTLGHGRFLLFYLASGLAAAYSQIYMNPASRVPMVGASGAVSGVLGAYLLLYPHARIVTAIFLGFFIQIVRIPALIVLSFWIVVQIINGTAALSIGGGGVAWFAHIGGFFAGIVLLKIFLGGRQRIPRGLKSTKWDYEDDLFDD
jgi:membrane associated rhomboid family serine protease